MHDPRHPPTSGQSRSRLALALLLTAVVLGISVRLAWLGDDAYITLRSVENWLQGNGLRWNTADRVQTYTHPLWMLVLAFGRWSSGEVFFTTIGIGLGLSTLAVFALLRACTTNAAMLATAALLVAAHTFTEYATSGLETPLSYVLLVAFAAIVTGERSAPQRYSLAVFCAALLATNRMDLALLCLPGVLATLRGVPWRAVLGRGLLASAPFWLWLGFASLYYGSPLPVTAHAKAFGVGIPATELAWQGLYYGWHTLRDDPVLLLTVLVGVVVGLAGKAPRGQRWLALGALLYLGYVVKVGGDFMAGRFFLPPFVVAVGGLAAWCSQRGPRVAWSCGGVAIALLIGHGVPLWLRSPASETQPTMDEIEAQHGIVDERRMHFGTLGLLAPGRAIPRFGALEALAWPTGRSERWFLLNGSVGTAGFGAGPRGHLVDPLLCDPLLARLPARDATRWRIGHILRRIPEGYYESLASGENRVRHAGLHRYYDALRTLTQAPVFDAERLATLARMAVGAYDVDLRAFLAEDYFQPPRVDVASTALATEVPLGVYWFDEPRLQLVYEGGLEVRLPGQATARALRVQTMGLCTFRFRFLRDGEVRGEAMGVPLPPPAGVQGLRAIAGLRAESVAVPEAVGPFDALWIDFVEIRDSDKSTGPAAIGAVTLVG